MRCGAMVSVCVAVVVFASGLLLQASSAPRRTTGPMPQFVSTTTPPARPDTRTTAIIAPNQNTNADGTLDAIVYLRGVPLSAFAATQRAAGVTGFALIGPVGAQVRALVAIAAPVQTMLEARGVVVRGYIYVTEHALLVQGDRVTLRGLSGVPGVESVAVSPPLRTDPQQPGRNPVVTMPPQLD